MYIRGILIVLLRLTKPLVFIVCVSVCVCVCVCVSVVKVQVFCNRKSRH